MPIGEAKIVLVTGGSRGIGRATSFRLAEEGYTVIVNFVKSQEDAEAVCLEIARRGLPEAVAIRADVSNLAETKDLFVTIKRRFGCLSVLVNNAGVVGDELFLLSKDERWWSNFHTNFASVVNCCRLALPLMIQQRGGAIVNMSSVSGIHGSPGQTAYSSAKAAIVGFSKSLAKEVAHSRISVNCIAPGLIDTEMIRGLGDEVVRKRVATNPMHRLGTPEEVAEVVALLVSGKVGYLFGQVLVIDGGASM